MSLIVVEVEKLMCQQRHEKSNDIGKHNTITVTIVYSARTHTNARSSKPPKANVQCTEKMVGNGDVVFFQNHLIKSFVGMKRTARGGENEA